MNWIIQHWVEIAGAIISFIYLYFEIKENYLMWIFGFIASSLYVVVYFKSGFYADMSLQVYYVAISIYGILYWTKGGKTEKKEDVPVTKINLKQIVLLSLITIIAFGAISRILILYTNSTVPYGDAFTTALSFVATWMLARKLIEHWYLWIVINSVSVVLYIYKGLDVTAVLFTVYFIFSFVGYFSWKKSLQMANGKRN
jgi:nicotinamide mononucleotide transporter